MYCTFIHNITVHHLKRSVYARVAGRRLLSCERRDLWEIGVLRTFSALNVCICAHERGVRARGGEWIVRECREDGREARARG